MSRQGFATTSPAMLEFANVTKWYGHIAALTDVSFRVGREIVGFRTAVLQVCAQPYAYLHLSYPDDVQRVEIRKNERVPVSIPAQVHASGASAITRMIGSVLLARTCTQRSGQSSRKPSPSVGWSAG